MRIDPAARRFFAMAGDETTSVSLQLWIEGVEELLPSECTPPGRHWLPLPRR